LPLALSKGCALLLAQARHLLLAFGTARIRQLRSVVSSFEGLASDDVR
jgi:hypothetical protein